jgi:hypothetical protein
MNTAFIVHVRTESVAIQKANWHVAVIQKRGLSTRFQPTVLVNVRKQPSAIVHQRLGILLGERLGVRASEARHGVLRGLLCGPFLHLVFLVAPVEHRPVRKAKAKCEKRPEAKGDVRD